METKNIIQEIRVLYNRPSVSSMERIHDSADAERVMRKVVDKDRIDLKEFFWVMLLSKSHHVLGVCQIGEGSASGVVVNAKEIFQLALNTNASGIILCHNHPSGSLKPSEADVTCTTEIEHVCEILDIRLHDHLIITSESYYSLTDNAC